MADEAAGQAGTDGKAADGAAGEGDAAAKEADAKEAAAKEAAAAGEGSKAEELKSQLAEQSKAVKIFNDIDQRYRTDPSFLENFDALWNGKLKAAGWNPIVNNGFDAARNPRYSTFGDRPKYLRWLAFETNGAGLYADYDVLPRRTFSPAKLGRAEGFNCLQYRDDKDGRPAIPAVVHADRAGIKAWINRLLAAQPEENILESVANEPWFHGREICRCVGEEGWEGFPIVHFGNEACRAYAPGNPKSAIMLNFVRSVESQ